LAYATTVHKAQGSEYPAVVLALTTSHYIMLQRRLLYTAVTRARRYLFIVGEEKALHLAIDNAAGDHQRHSGLGWRLARQQQSQSGQGGH
jgi:exodeoxyribonuclease V alpha subunit